MTKRCVSGNVLTMLLAGEDTTANTLAWAIYLLHRHPETLRRASEEASRAAQGAGWTRRPALRRTATTSKPAPRDHAAQAGGAVPRLQTLRDMVSAGSDRYAGHDALVRVAARLAARTATSPAPPNFDPSAGWTRTAAAASSRQARLDAVRRRAARLPGALSGLLEMKLALAMLLSQFDIQAVDTPDGQAAREIMSFTMTPVGLTLKLAPKSP
jgi:cytochrome P450